MSDGGRGRASVVVEGWKSSQKWSVHWSAVRSIAWLGLDEFLVVPSPLGPVDACGPVTKNNKPTVLDRKPIIRLPDRWCLDAESNARLKNVARLAENFVVRAMLHCPGPNRRLELVRKRLENLAAPFRCLGERGEATRLVRFQGALDKASKCRWRVHET
jgi:hypothetical protein